MRHSYKEMEKELLSWYDDNARVLPWRSDPRPYYVWVSEIMLQQTRVEAVREYFRRFTEALPDVESLSAAEDDRLMKLWEGLGYYNRARNMKKAAIIIMEEHGGILPPDYAKLLTLPGIGSYTAGAISSIAYGIAVPAVDGNVLRVAKRLSGSFDDISKASVKKELEEELKSILPGDRPGDYNQALMELGATVCIPNGKPFCRACPVASHCEGLKNGTLLRIPVRPPKKSRRVEERTVLLLEYQSRYAIHKRPDKGLLAGLWELPNLEGRMAIEKVEKMLEKLGIREYTMELLGEAKHIFSHIEWHMLGYCIHIREGEEGIRAEELGELSALTWVEREKMNADYALPSAFSFYQEAIR